MSGALESRSPRPPGCGGRRPRRPAAGGGAGAGGTAQLSPDAGELRLEPRAERQRAPEQRSSSRGRTVGNNAAPLGCRRRCLYHSSSLQCFKHSNPKTNPQAAHENRELTAIWKHAYCKRGKLSLLAEKVIGRLKTWASGVLIMLFCFYFLQQPATKETLFSHTVDAERL